MSETENKPSVASTPDAPQASEVKTEAGTQEAKPSVESTPVTAATEKKADSSAEPAPTAMETEPAAATNGTESKPEGGDATPSTEEESKKAVDGANGNSTPKKEKQRFTTVARKRFRLLIGQGYSRTEAARLAQEPLKPGVVPKKQPKAKFDFDEERKKLTGAARKRLAWLLRNGYQEREAIAKAREPMSKILAPAPAKPAKPVTGVIAMAVVQSDHPVHVLSKEQSNKIKSGILKQVMQQKDSQLKPCFEDCVFVNGYLRVVCSDKPTIKFLRENIPKLELWKDASLKVVSEKSILNITTYIGFFTDSRQNSNEEILNFVECQNDGISTNNWKILGRKEVLNKTIELKLSIDMASARQIRELGDEVNYKFNKARIVKERKPAPQTNAPRNVAAPLQGPRRRGPGPVVSRSYNQNNRNFVPVWDNNMPKQNVFNRVPSPPRRNSYDNYNRSSSFNNSGSRGNNWGGNSNSYNNSNGGGGGGHSNSRPLSLVDNLFNQLNRSLAASSDNRGNNRSNNRGNNSYDRQGSTRRPNNFGSSPYARNGNRSSYNSRSGFF